MVEPKTDYEIKLLKIVTKFRKSLLNEAKSFFSLNSVVANLFDERYFDYHLIIKALDHHHLDLAKLMIEKDFRVYKKSKSGQEKTVLHAAIPSGDEDFITTLLIKGASVDILTFDEQYKTPFHLAIDMKGTSVIELFLPQFDAKAFDENHFLHYAVEKGNNEAVSLLMKKGLSVKKKNNENLTPFCVALKNENYKILDILLSPCNMKEIEPNSYDDIAPVYMASICGNLKLIKEYAGSGLPINIPIKLSVDSWPCLANCSGFTLLHFAVKYIKLKMVEFLLSIGADIFVKNGNGSSALHIAFETKQIGKWNEWQDFHDNNAIIDLILKANRKFNSNPINNDALSHFHIACSRDEPAIVEHFMKIGASINQQVNSECHPHRKYSPLHFAAKFRCMNTMELLLKNGADVEQRDFKNMTALHIAAQESCLNTVSLLLDYDTSITSVDSHGKTPIHWAFENKSYGILDLLLSVPYVACSNCTNNKGISHFHIACTRNNVNVVRGFIENGASIDTCVPTNSGNDNVFGVVDWSGYSSLHLAVAHNRAEIVQLLLHCGANVGVKDNNGETPFHLACHYNHEMFGEFIENVLYDLIKKGKVVQSIQSFTDVEKMSRWMYEENSKFSGSIEEIDWSANRNDHLKILRLLLNHGSNVNCLDNKCNTPFFYACAAVNDIDDVVENIMNYCSEDLWTEITESLSAELYERRQLILNDLLELDVNLDKCSSNRSILHSMRFDDKEFDEMMELFLKKGANVDAQYDLEDGLIQTPLLGALTCKKTNFVNLLLKYKANVDIIVDPLENKTLLLYVSGKNLVTALEVLDSLIRKSKNVNAKQLDGKTILHILASNWLPIGLQIGLFSAISNLIKAGADVDSRDDKGLTALHMACEKGHSLIANILLDHGADVNIENNKGRNACHIFYRSHKSSVSELFRNFNDINRSKVSRIVQMVNLLHKHVTKLIEVGLPVTEKLLSSISKCNKMISQSTDRLTDQEKRKLIDECQAEVQVLRDTKIHIGCSLHDVILKNENTLSRLIENSAFIDLMKSKSFESKYRNYGYLIKLKYQGGVDRNKLLPGAKFVLKNLAGKDLPDECSENIFKYFTNFELKVSTEILLRVLDLKAENSDEISSRSSGVHKRQKVD